MKKKHWKMASVVPKSLIWLFGKSKTSNLKICFEKGAGKVKVLGNIGRLCIT